MRREMKKSSSLIWNIGKQELNEGNGMVWKQTDTLWTGSLSIIDNSLAKLVWVE